LDSEPPAIVWEGRGVCTHSDRAESLLRRGIASSTAPGSMWVVNVHLESPAPHSLLAEGEITDDDGMPVAHRSLVGSDCDGLARAVGVWASLVLDTETERAERQAASEAPPPPEPTGGASAPWPAPAPLEPPSPEHDWYLHHAEERNLEVGVAAFLMTGAGATAMAGPSPFVVVEAGHGLYLRPSIVVGGSLASLSPYADVRSTVAATRFDTCLRMPGLYTQHRGMQLDTCLGADLGFTHVDGTGAPSGGGIPSAGVPVSGLTLPYFSVGPSLELRGELGSALAVALRGLAGVNIGQQGFQDSTSAYVAPMAWTGRVELALSWGLR
jgi:hypothetical protein